MHCTVSVTRGSPHDAQLTTSRSAPSLLLVHVQTTQITVETSTHRGKATCEDNRTSPLLVLGLAMCSGMH